MHGAFHVEAAALEQQMLVHSGKTTSKQHRYSQQQTPTGKPVIAPPVSTDLNSSSNLKQTNSNNSIFIKMPPNTTASPAVENSTSAPESTVHVDAGGLTSSSMEVALGSELPSVADFYRNRNLLITGATGFMGKVLVEKLLRSCSSVGKIYLLMRPRDKKDVQSRLDDLLKSKLFDNVRQNSAEVLGKLIAVQGDIMQPGLGLSDEDTDLLAAEVSVVFHCAATVKFDEAIKLSLQMNVLGTKRMVELCHKMTNLVSLVHVSTAYCNCDRDEIDEIVYAPPSDPYKLLKLLDLLDDDHFNALTTKLVGNRPNTYTFTKALAETVLVNESKGLPVSIVRPSIVAAAWREPIPGWVDNFNGPTGLIVGAGKGMLRTLHCHENLIADLIPVDIPINLLIVTACYTAMNRKSDDIKVFNCVSGMERPVRWKDVRDHGMFALKKDAAMTDVMWYPSLHFSSSNWLNTAGSFVQHWLPAYFLDALAKAAGKKPIMVRVARKLDRAAACLEYFTTHEWSFNSTNVQSLWGLLSTHDKQMFNFELESLDWPTYMHQYCKGTKLHVMKEDDSTLQSSRTRINRLWYLHRAFRTVMVLLIWRALMLRSPAARNAFYALIRALLRMISYLPIINRI